MRYLRSNEKDYDMEFGVNIPFVHTWRRSAAVSRGAVGRSFDHQAEHPDSSTWCTAGLMTLLDVAMPWPRAASTRRWGWVTIR